MKRIFALAAVTLLFFSQPGRAQKSSGNADRHYYYAPAVSYYWLPIASLNAQLYDYGIHTGFQNAIGVGLENGTNTSTDVIPVGFTTLISYHYFLPQQVSTPGDSLKFRMNGYCVQVDLIGMDFISEQHVTLTGGVAWAFGRLKVTKTVGGAESRFTNPYLSPEARLELNVRLGGHFYVGVRGSYMDDISRSGWKRRGADSPDIGGTRLSGPTAGAFIGWGK